MATYSGKQFEAYISLQSDALGTNDVSGTLYKMRLAQVNDIDFSAGVQLTPVERTGQRVLRPTDHIAVRGGGTYSWSFSDYIVENEALLQLLLQLATEDTSPSGTAQILGNQGTVSYAEGASTGEYACVVISSPDADKDRLMFSSILQELTLSMNPTANGGRLTASGTFFSGYQPVIGAEATSPDATAVDYTKGFFDCSTQSLGGASVLANSFDLTISNPATRVGFKTVNSIAGEPESYNRGGQINVTGNISVKMDDNSVTMVNNFLGGTSTNVSLGDGSSIDFDIPTAKFTGHELDTANENGVFINLPFQATADGSGALVTIIAT
tara:strand:+ start:3037 stop:4014 length:978 start_codon:yes stop_codon:yes gene_type:complete